MRSRLLRAVPKSHRIIFLKIPSANAFNRLPTFVYHGPSRGSIRDKEALPTSERASSACPVSYGVDFRNQLRIGT